MLIQVAHISKVPLGEELDLCDLVVEGAGGEERRDEKSERGGCERGCC